MKKAVLNVSTKRVIRSCEEWMKSNGLNKTQAAKKAGIPYTNFCSLMSGRNEMSARMAIKILHACDGKIAKSQRSK